MKAATLNEIKKELTEHSAEELLELCARLTRFKKENKELLTYLIFEAHDEAEYIRSIKDDIDQQFATINKKNTLYLLNKGLRKILRTASKYVRYTGSKSVEIQVLMYYCLVLKESGIPLHRTVAISNLFQTQLLKIQKLIPHFHEDLQYDFKKELEDLKMF